MGHLCIPPGFPAWSWAGARDYRQEEAELLGSVFLEDFEVPS